MTDSKKMLKLNRYGQVTIPKEYRERFGLDEGSYVSIDITAEGILLRPVEIVIRESQPI